MSEEDSKGCDGVLNGYKFIHFGDMDTIHHYSDFKFCDRIFTHSRFNSMTCKKHVQRTFYASILRLQVCFLSTITNVCAMLLRWYWPLSSGVGFFCVKQNSTRNNYDLKLHNDNHCHTSPLEACGYTSFPTDTTWHFVSIMSCFWLIRNS